MPHRTIIMLSVFAIALTATSAGAADLPRQSWLGAIFAEPGQVRADAGPQNGYSAPVIGYNHLPNPPWARGGYNYGSYFSYYDGGAYYGGPNVSYVVRLPYACGFVGYC